MFCGGGSAGHVIPNIAVIEDIKKDYSVCYAGTDAIEENICRTNNVEFHKFEAVKLIRGKIFRNILIPFKLLKSIKQAGEILDRVKPDLVFCKGGYACIPPAFAAKKRGIPVLTHESDLSAGLANKIISNKCKKVLTAFPSTSTVQVPQAPSLHPSFAEVIFKSSLRNDSKGLSVSEYTVFLLMFSSNM